MIISKEVEMTWGNNRKIYEPLGYRYTKKGDKFIVKIKDLSLNSHAVIKLSCDYCKIEYNSLMSDHTKKNTNGIIHKDTCKNCKGIKEQESNTNIYGVKSPNQKDITILKIKQEFLDKSLILINDKYEDSRSDLFYICIKHKDKGIQAVNYHDFKNNRFTCNYCAKDFQRDSQSTPWEKIKKDFKKRGYEALSDYYNKNLRYIIYNCPKHGIKNINYSSFNQGHSCEECYHESVSGKGSSHWKGGITPLHNYLRSHGILQWKKDSMKNCNYKCVITGNRFDVIHHLYGFDQILQELIKDLNLENIDFNKIKIEDLPKEQLKQIEDKCIELHNKYPLGVCLTKEIHKLFHQQYGYGNNTSEQFYEFKKRYDLGEFTIK